jgi:DNA repair protein RecO (recombination protein O)
MMQEWSETVLVMRVGVLREADCWVRFFSPSRGMVSAFAFGGRRSRRRFGGCLDPLLRVLFTIAPDRHRRYLVLQEGHVVERFSSLKDRLDRLGMASNCIRFVERLTVPPESASFVHDAVVQALRLLDSRQPVPSFFPVLFRAHLVFGLGFVPTVQACSRCGADPGQRPAFSIPQGGVLCPRCAGGERTISRQALNILRELRRPLPAPWATRPLSHTVREECVHLVDHFVRWHMDLSPGSSLEM